MGSASDLLRTHRPVLRYDSNECYFADSAQEWTDHHGNRLKRGEETLAVADPRSGAPALSLGFLGKAYPGGEEAKGTDLIDCPDKNYVADAAEMHEDPTYRNKMYGRTVREPRGGALWLQYWFFYFYNDFNVIGPLIKAGLHEGDWEMIQLRVGPGGTPDLAAYAQHKGAEVRPWDKVELGADGLRPLVYVARGSHASYFEAGPHWTGYWWDQANGKRDTPELELLEIDVDVPEWSWIRWPGRWGGTTGGDLPMDDDSPTGPIEHDQWHDPGVLLPRAAAKQSLVAAAPAPPRPLLESIKVDRTATGITVRYATEPVGHEELLGLAVTINSPDEAGVPPSTYTVEASTPSGTADILVPLDREKAYDITVSAAFVPHVATEAITAELPADPAQPAPATTPPPAEG